MDNHELRNDAAKVVKKKIGFYIHLVVYVLVNAGLAAINLSASPERIWFVWPLLGWGIGIVFHALMVFVFPKGNRLRDWMIEREMKKRSASKP